MLALEPTALLEPLKLGLMKKATFWLLVTLKLKEGIDGLGDPSGGRVGNCNLGCFGSLPAASREVGRPTFFLSVIQWCNANVQIKCVQLRFLIILITAYLGSSSGINFPLVVKLFFFYPLS